MRWALVTAAAVALVVVMGMTKAVEAVGPVAETRRVLEQVREHVAAADWEAAERRLPGLGAAWKRAMPILAVFASHGDLLAFEVELARFEAAVRNRDAGAADQAADAALAVWYRMVSW